MGKRSGVDPNYGRVVKAFLGGVECVLYLVEFDRETEKLRCVDRSGTMYRLRAHPKLVRSTEEKLDRSEIDGFIAKAYVRSQQVRAARKEG